MHCIIYNIFSKSKLVIIFIVFLLTACTSEPVNKSHDICEIYNKNYHWYRAAMHAQNKHNIDASIIMAVLAQESNFSHDARPQKKYILYFIPWGYTTSAKGYAQALNGAWSDYLKENPSWFASRGNFQDSTDFVGWYLNKAAIKLKINRQDTYHLYLAYHEGINGYKRKKTHNNPQLKKISTNVTKLQKKYANDFNACSQSLWLWHWLYVWDY